MRQLILTQTYSKSKQGLYSEKIILNRGSSCPVCSPSCKLHDHLCTVSNYNVQCSLVKLPPSVQSVVWRYNEFGDKLRDSENRKLCDHMKR